MAQTLRTQDQLKEARIKRKLTGLDWKKRLRSLSRASVRHGQKSDLKIGILLLATRAPTKTHKFLAIMALLVLRKLEHLIRQRRG